MRGKEKKKERPWIAVLIFSRKLRRAHHSRIDWPTLSLILDYDCSSLDVTPYMSAKETNHPLKIEDSLRKMPATICSH